jgi:predicted nucleic acid-binding protein
MAANFVPEDVIIADSTVLINFIESGQFALLLKVFEGRLHITDVVSAEIKRKRQPLAEAITSGKIIVHPTDIENLPRLVRQYSLLLLLIRACLSCNLM